MYERRSAGCTAETAPLLISIFLHSDGRSRLRGFRRQQRLVKHIFRDIRDTYVPVVDGLIFVLSTVVDQRKSDGIVDCRVIRSTELMFEPIEH